MAETVSMPKLGFDMAEGTLVRWVKKEGETVNKGEVLAEIETDKATVEVESSASGVVRRLLVDEKAVVPVGSPIAIVGTADEALPEPASAGPAPTKKDEKKTGSPAAPAPVTLPTPAPSKVEGPAAVPVALPISATGPVKASPLAKRIARDSKVDLSRLQGSGPGGRIVRRDVEAALAGGSAPAAAAALLPAVLTDQTVPLSKLRQAIARRMTESKTSIPHFYVTHEYRLEALLELRRQFNAIVPEAEKLSVNDFIVKAAALTLRQFPNLNASFDGSSVLRHGDIHIGVAVSVEGGLLTVVCREADRKPLRQVSAELKELAGRARQGKVRPDDIQGSTFSISNLGMYEVENFAAILNPPEAAILAVGSAREVPVVVDGAVKPGWRMKVTLSVDHRVSDGAEGARFLQALAVYIEEPLRLLI
jgi:pyruvate dehydrogenase E2 component (dihydrolipoamide acetyltransferase)